MNWIDELCYDEHGLVPVIAQDAGSGEVLMLAWANRAALEATLRTGRGHYWSRSRQSLWEKGATSGHTQAVRDVRVDCDADAVLYLVVQTGPACHTGRRSCFAAPGGAEPGPITGASSAVLDRVAEVIEQRRIERPEGSYTTYLFEQGVDKILKKLGEEATETVIAAKNGRLDELRSETADLLYHLLVLLAERRLPVAEVYAELDERFGATPRPGSSTPPPSRASDGT